MNVSPEWLSAADAAVCALLLPLAVWILFSGLDDLIVDIAGALAYIRSRLRGRPTRRAVLAAEQRRIAIFVPCWGEHEVIDQMIERNRARINYRRCDLFVGAYPNDPATVATVRELSERFLDVHLATCPHDGPTSKADCLNWIYQRMLLHEAETGECFDIIVTHDAEDVIHAEALHWINWYSRDYDMIQIPVLPLPTPVTHWTHGIYCDEFAEFQARDMPARQFMGAFVPSNGVGTGFRRDSLENLAADEGNRIFEPVCLTEDYENGLRLRLRGAKQMFVRTGRRNVATREYFPKTFGSAVRQRTRWITGIALQTWDRHGWEGNLAVKYWLWRDRKGLIGNPASLLTNLIFVYGLLTWAAAQAGGWAWGLQEETARNMHLLIATSILGTYRLVYRAACVAPEFGILFALVTPVRVVVANCINSMSTMNAVYRFAWARFRGQPLRWVKTAHQYPNAAALLADRQMIGEILVGCGYVTREQLESGLATQPSGKRIGEHLIVLGYLDEDSLYDALSLQTGLPQSWIDPRDVPVRTARSLPARVSRECRIIPVRVEEGRLYLAGPDVPDGELERAVRRMTSLEPRFSLVTPSNYTQLIEALF